LLVGYLYFRGKREYHVPLRPSFTDSFPDLPLDKTEKENLEDSSLLLALIGNIPEIAPSSKPAKIINRKPNHYFLPKRLWISQTEGTRPGIGYGVNFSSVGILLAPDYVRGQVLSMIDIRGHHFNNQTYAANFGLVARYIPKSFCALLGLNAYYDYRQGSKGGYHQIGAGMEVLGKRWDFRANGYFPLGQREHTSKCVFDDYIGDFFAIRRKTEFSSYGGNAELGWFILRSKDFFLYTAAGPYFFSGKCHHATAGGEIRLRPQFKDYLALDLRLSHDSTYKTNFQGELIFSIPLYDFFSFLKNKKGPCGISNQQIYQRVERFEIMPLGKRCGWESNF